MEHRWDPQQYLQFADERSRAFTDLLAGVGAADPRVVVDLGCGPGGLTALLARRWPRARVRGLDSSPDMVERARADVPDPNVEFALGDLREWHPAEPVDVLVTSATLQWVPGHLDLLPALVGALAPGGWFAMQVPLTFDQPTHLALRELAEQPRWRDHLAAAPRPAAHHAAAYLAVLAGEGLAVDAWETTYLQVLPGPDAVLEWMLGTGARPSVQALPAAERPAFLAAYAERLRAAYPRTAVGTVLPYRRVFAVARRPG